MRHGETSSGSSGSRWHHSRLIIPDPVYPVVALLLGLATLELWIRLADIPPFLMPPVSAIFAELLTEAPSFLPHIVVTVKETLLGFILCILVAIPLAIALDTSRRIALSVFPIIVASQLIPLVAVAPLLVLWFGFGLLPKVLTVFLISFFPLVIHSVTGLRVIEAEKLYLARSMGANWLTILTRFKLPNALPSMFAGGKLSATYAVLGAVLAEFVASSEGLGHVVLTSSGRLATLTLFVAVLNLTIIGVCLFGLVRYIERRAIPWHAGAIKPS